MSRSAQTSYFDVIVIGGGHAGTEAAMAAARMGAKTLLLTHNIETIGQMSCNPAIGGIGKGHLTKEIDALGGMMAQAIDHAGIHFRTLNASKGPAVRATRAQADRNLYKKTVRALLESQEHLFFFQQAAQDLIVEKDQVVGVVTQMGLKFKASTVVIAAGTFLGGKIHIGGASYSGGRAGDPPSIALAERLRALPFRVERLKTGTPPRLDGRTINFSVLQEQPSDASVQPFSFVGDVASRPKQVSCFLTNTSEKTHEIIQEYLEESPVFSGKISGTGPRYCPSIEDKVVRFAERNSHRIFIEPEGLDTHEIYPNGISTSLPFEAQKAFIASIKGFEKAHITRPGYAIEYDFFDPRDLNPWLETKYIKNLFFAGQINGTTGYEEAAAQGLLAGINAVLQSRGEAPWYPRRDEAYLGVLVDDLITNGTNEPYRMFTSRAEYRLLLREDNADLRLTLVGKQLGLIDDVRWERFCAKKQAVEAENKRLNQTRVHPDTPEAEKLAAQSQGTETILRDFTLAELLKRPEINYDILATAIPEKGPFSTDPQVRAQVEIQAKYAGYIGRQEKEIEKHARHEQAKLPDNIDYQAITALSHEVRQKLTAAKPQTIGQASRIPGVTPAAISLLLVYIKKN